MEAVAPERTPGQASSRRRLTETTTVCHTEASVMGGTYCNKSGTRNQSRFLAFVPDMVAGLEERANPLSLQLLVDGQWQVHRVSPLWGVPFLPPRGPELEPEYDRRALARLARGLGEVVGRHAEVEMQPLGGLRGSRFDKEALRIQVKSGMAGRKVNVFDGVLCGSEVRELRLKCGEATSLPVLLTRGTSDITEKVIAGLERSFDCVVGRLALPPRELQWVAAMWAGIRLGDLEEGGVAGQAGVDGAGDHAQDKDKARDEAVLDGTGDHAQDNDTKAAGDVGLVKLTYEIPKSLGAKIREQISHFTLEFSAADVREVWRCCRDAEAASGGAGNEFNVDEMEAFHKSLGLHVLETLGLRLERLDLMQVELPFLKAHKGGRVVFGAAEQVKTVLKYLTELCQTDVLQANPTLAVAEDIEFDDISMTYTVQR